MKRPLDAESLQRMALHYVGRYATTRARLRFYLKRKVTERGWAGDSPPEIEALAERMSGAGYVDDAAYAASRSRSLIGRGYGGHRIRQSLSAAGVAEEDRPQSDADEAYDAADRFARRRRIGPYAPERGDPDQKRRQLAAFLRAGHALDLARRFVEAAPGQHPEPPEQE